MKAVILAGGYGKRLMPLTSVNPKPLLDVAGKPIIDWQISWLNRSGIDSFVVLCGYLKEKIRSHMKILKKEFDIDVELAIESTPLGTGGALRNARKSIGDERFIAINGDVITNLDVGKLKLGTAVATIALTQLRSPFGIVRSASGKVRKFDEKPYIKNYWINAGAYLMNDEIFDYLPRKGDIERTAFTVLAERKMLNGTQYRNVYWHSIDSIKDLEETSKDVRRGALRR
ncbi:MAG: nucleotidyltransferase family protein [Candidatus Marsarchaeota archaeon]|nr:nucleotidyltransferase family protein [Candidatus Marsarchaeota archaeon]